MSVASGVSWGVNNSVPGIGNRDVDMEVGTKFVDISWLMSVLFLFTALSFVPAEKPGSLPRPVHQWLNTYL